ncbi:hypothetical protein [Streptomyces sp. NPDC021224]|uniref:hypothetical protein n=1 Tax=unclassified Streptomyces TaxID=2593676 RepID=UPI0037BB549F
MPSPDALPSALVAGTEVLVAALRLDERDASSLRTREWARKRLAGAVIGAPPQFRSGPDAFRFNV